ncbi:MAG: hypothetical protein ACE141_15300 [Bryobacteraceae bacterium]
MSLTRMAVIAAVTALGAQAQVACDRACLTGYIDTYFAALAANNPSALPLAANAKITANGEVMPLARTFWQGVKGTAYRWDIVNVRRGDTGTEAVISNADGSKTMFMLRLKVMDGKITEIETIKCNKGEADQLWDPDALREVSSSLQLSIREVERDSYYDLIGTAEGYWRAFQTNGTPLYRPARLLPDCRRFENGLQTTGMVRDGQYQSAALSFEKGDLVGRNLWDRRYPVVDEERGIVLSIVRFGMKADAEGRTSSIAHDRLVGEFFAIKSGWIQEIHAVLVNRSDDQPTGWTPDYGPGRGGN